MGSARNAAKRRSCLGAMLVLNAWKSIASIWQSNDICDKTRRKGMRADMDIDETLEEIQKIADHYGYTHQSMKTIEECAELIKAIADDDPEEIIEEMADVQIMIWQMTGLMVCGGRLDDQIVFKLERQLKRMEEDDSA